MEQKPLISVIVPVYNVESLLERCVDSILGQTYEALEVILVDDGSKDRSGAICDAYAAKDSRVRVIHKENGGLSSARNAGIDAAKGTFLAFVDSDDWIERDAYAGMLEAALRQDVKLVCAGRYDVMSETGAREIGLCPQREEVISAEELLGRIFIWDQCDSAAWDKLYHASLFHELRYPLGKTSEDIPVTYLLALRAGRVAMHSKPIYNYYHRAGSITTAAVSEKTFHFAEHAAEIYPFIRENYPHIEKQAHYFLVRSLVHSVQSVDLADRNARESFKGHGDRYRRQLRRHIGYIMSSPYFGVQERITDLMLLCGIYRPLRKLYHAVK